MTINEILGKCSHLKVEEKRVSSIDYEEWVICKQDIDLWNSILSEFLGAPVKSAGEKTTQRHFALAVNYGGLFDQQTLFYRKFEEQSVIVMFWPWRDDIHVTLKIASIKE